jgi:hypothetical protein
MRRRSRHRALAEEDSRQIGEKRACPSAEWPLACFTSAPSPDGPITRLLSFHDDLSGHIVVSCPANNAALHRELTLSNRELTLSSSIKSDRNGSTWLNGFVNAKLLHLKPMLDIPTGDI